MVSTDYMNAEKFPLTTQEGLTEEEQMFLDMAKYDMAQEFIDNGDKMNPTQEAVWKELQEKRAMLDKDEPAPSPSRKPIPPQVKK